MSLPIFRASSLTRLIACPASGALPQENDGPSEYSDIGTAGHRFVEATLIGAAYEADPQFRDMISRIDLDALPKRKVGATDYVEWSTHYLSDRGRVEAALPDNPHLDPRTSVTGTADFVRVDESVGTVTVIDWKFGRPEYTTRVDANKQLLFYGMAASIYFGIGDVIIQLGFIDQDTGKITYESRRVGEKEFSVLRAEIAAALSERIAYSHRIAAGLPPDVTEGSYCHFCPARRTCPAKTGLIRQFASGLVLRVDGQITPEKVGEAWSKVQSIKQAIADFEGQVAFWVRSYGSVPLPSGKTLGMKSRRGNEVLDPATAFSVITEDLGVEVAERCMTRTVSKVAILNAIKKEGLPNKKADELIEAIREAGGSTRNKDSSYVGEL